MSDTDSFIDEVTEEVRRDRLFKAMRRYGWIAVLAVLGIVGAAAWNEWNKAQQQAKAEEFGDALLSAMESPDGALRADALAEVEAPNPASQAVVDLLAAGQSAEADPSSAAERLLALADQSDVDTVYRQIATLKAVTLRNSGLTPDARRTRLEGLALGTGVIRLLAEEQLALIDVELGDTDAALTRFQSLLADAEVTTGLRARASQVIVALGGDLSGADTGE